MEDTGEFLSASDAARILGVTRQRVTALAHEGRLGRRVGYYYVFTREEIEQYRDEPKSKGGRPKESGLLMPQDQLLISSPRY